MHTHEQHLRTILSIMAQCLDRPSESPRGDGRSICAGPKKKSKIEAIFSRLRRFFSSHAARRRGLGLRPHRADDRCDIRASLLLICAITHAPLSESESIERPAAAAAGEPRGEGPTECRPPLQPLQAPPGPKATAASTPSAWDGGMHDQPTALLRKGKRKDAEPASELRHEPFGSPAVGHQVHGVGFSPWHANLDPVPELEEAFAPRDVKR